MATVSKRHTYYGGDTSSPQNETPDNIHNSEEQKQRRRHVTFGPYYIGSTLGEGEFGKVKLGWTQSSSFSATEVSKQVAIKLIRRDTITKNSDKEVKIYREINALKHLTHPNIVRLEEVLQNSKYIGIVLEYASGGEFYKYIQKKRRLKEPLACRLFAQLASGLYYMHSKGLVHRDLKLENLLLDKHENLIITDFGFVNEFSRDMELMKTSCGSPCYAAPELVVSTKPYEARKADVWSCGIILYAMLAGYLPWDDDISNPDGDDIAKLYYYITRTPLKFPDYISPVPRDLLRRILVSDPRRRISLRYIQQHEWMKPHTPFLSITTEEWDKTMNAKEVFRPPKPKVLQNRRPHSGSSVSSSGSKGDKRDSLVMDSTLLHVPAPPQESQSHATAKPSSTSHEKQESKTKSTYIHTRSNSAASVALQAVVDAEREFISHHEISLHSQKSTPSNTPKKHPAGSQRSHTQHTMASSSLMNNDSVIVESPTKNANPNNYDSYGRIGTIIPTQSLNNTTHHFKSHSAQNNRDKNGQLKQSASHRKPRPTSYQPTYSYSTTDEISNDNLLNMQNETVAISRAFVDGFERKQFDSNPSLLSGTMLRSPSSGESPKMLTGNSFSASKPSVELQSASGNLIQYQDVAGTVRKQVCEKVDEPESKAHRRRHPYSVIMAKTNSYIEEDTSKQVEDVEHPKSDKDNEKRGHNSKVKDTDNEKKIMERSDDQNNENYTNTHKSTMNQDNNNINTEINDFKLKPTMRSKQGMSESPYKSLDPQDISLKDTMRNASSSRRSDKKRFSFLSFYSSYNTSKSSVNSNEVNGRNGTSTSIDSASKNSNTQSKQATTGNNNNNNNNNSNNSNRVPAEARHSSVNSRTSNKTYERKKNNRSSIMVSSLNESGQETNFTNVADGHNEQQRDPSTAKKVIDFFKRRSMRL